MERGSDHPLAEVIVAGARDRGLPLGSGANFEAVTGKGVHGTVDGRRVALGNSAMMHDLGLEAKDIEARADTLRADGKTAMYVAIEGTIAGIVAVADPIKESTADAIRDLHALGLTIIMATGDNQRTA